ncbi:hypothetical protein B9G54_02895 [Alloscardovia macacae]|uniref:Uncharacterized protein n=1 Tax=Alloscardovia macacae TaxID=1160091 RepID=A0A1Y2SVI6_9BIFI|nr:hypothetical protein B9G54_02895 [Alloscardovia macacae]OTA30020.1 hypothetical protein B9T39_01255 [Alloscardovia macacae]
MKIQRSYSCQSENAQKNSTCERMSFSMGIFSSLFRGAEKVQHSKSDSAHSDVRNHGEENHIMCSTPGWVCGKLEIIQKSVNHAEEKNKKTDSPAQYDKKLM